MSCKDKHKARRLRGEADGWGAVIAMRSQEPSKVRRIAAPRRQSAPAPVVGPPVVPVVAVGPAVAAELALLAEDGLLEAEVAWLGDLLVGRAATLDAAPLLPLVPGLVVEFTKTYLALVSAVEAADEVMPRVSSVPSVRVEAPGPLVTSTLARLAELGLDPAGDVLAAVAVMLAGYLDGGPGNAEAPLSKALRSVMAQLRPPEAIDPFMAELLAPFDRGVVPAERPGGVW